MRARQDIALKEETQLREEEEVLARVALRLAGFTKNDLQAALKRNRDALDASQIKVFYDKGRLVYSDPLADHPVRLAAAENIMRMVPGLYAAKHEEPRAGNLTVEVVTMAPDGTRLAIQVKTDGRD